MMMVEAVHGRALVVEDDERVREMLCDVLAELGYDPEPAANGSEAVARFQQESFRLVVTDYKMPGLSGLDLAKLVRARDAGVDVLIVTGYSTEFECEARALGIPVLPKPVDFNTFARLVESIRARRRGQAGSP